VVIEHGRVEGPSDRSLAAIIATSAKPNPIDNDKPPSVYSIPQPRRGSGVLPEPSIKIVYDLLKSAQLIAAENENGPRRRFMVEFRRRKSDGSQTATTFHNVYYVNLCARLKNGPVPAE
jgi:hypothetical protein